MAAPVINTPASYLNPYRSCLMGLIRLLDVLGERG